MSEIFVTSDTHFCHNQPFIYKARGFNNIDEMNEAIIERWNSVVKDDDIVYHLGDVMLNNNEKGLECVRRLNGTIYLALGNHDTDARIELFKTCPNIKEIAAGFRIKVNKKVIMLSHYWQNTRNEEDDPRKHPVYSFFGHLHQKSYAHWTIFDCHCGMDSFNCYPVKIKDCLDLLAKETTLQEMENKRVGGDLF